MNIFNSFDITELLATTEKVVTVRSKSTQLNTELDNTSEEHWKLSQNLLDQLRPLGKSIGVKLPKRPDECAGISLDLLCLLLQKLQQSLPAPASPISGVRHRQDNAGNDRWQARVELPNGSSPSLGVFDTVAEANAALKGAKRMLELLRAPEQASTKLELEAEEIKSDHKITFDIKTGKWSFNLYGSIPRCSAA